MVLREKLLEKLKLIKSNDAIQNGTLQAVKTKYHKEFLHSGGISRFVSARR